MSITKASGFLHNSLNSAWLLLVGATLLGWWLGHTVHQAQGNIRLAAVGVLIVAFVKTWIVGDQFMELRQAPWWLKHSFNIWVIALCAVLLYLYV